MVVLSFQGDLLILFSLGLGILALGWVVSMIRLTFLILAFLAPQLGLAGAANYLCHETVSLNVNYNDEVRNYKLGTVIINIDENDVVMIHSPIGTDSQELAPYNHGGSGLKARGQYCSIHIQSNQPPKQFVCYYGDSIGVTIQNVECIEF